MSALDCSSDGSTVIYVNGIFSKSITDAKESKQDLEDEFKARTGKTDVKFIVGYNPSHLAGVGDLVQSIAQAFAKPISAYDRDTILMQIHPEVTTQKILLIGHSQGTFYTNELYNYLTAHGVPKSSIAVYNLATPASFVAGGGAYINSTNDKLINKVRDMEVNGNLRIFADSHYLVQGVVASALRANAMIAKEPGWEESAYGGHGFSVYLDGATSRIVKEIETELGKLNATEPVTAKEGCFEPPARDVVYNAKSALYAVADPLADMLWESNAGTIKSVLAGASVLREAVGGAFSVLASATNRSQAAVASLPLDAQQVATKSDVPVTSARTEPVTATPRELERPPELTPTPPRSGLQDSPEPEQQQEAEEPRPQDAEQQEAFTEPIAVPGYGASGGVRTASPAPSLAVASPADGALFATTTVSFSGTTSANATVTATYGTANTNVAADASGNWSASLTLSEGNASVSFTADASGAVSGAVTRNVVVDITSPDVPTLLITECGFSLSASFCLIPANTANLSWGSATGASHYAIATNGVPGATTTSLSSPAGLASGATTTLAVVAYDSAGNAATSTSQDVRHATQPLVINEIGWGGTVDSSTNQWIEIKNNSSYELTLSNVSVTRSSGSPAIQLSGALPNTNAKYFVVARESTSFMGSHTLLNAFPALSTGAAEQLSLVWNGSTTMDATPAVGTCASWCAGSLSTALGSNVSGVSNLMSPLSMERKTTGTDGTLAASWQGTDSYGPWLGGSNTAALFGTPGDANSNGYPEYGVLCGSNGLVTADQPYQFGSGCTYLSRFITGNTFGVNRYGALYRGVVASSTAVNSHLLAKGLAKFEDDSILNPISGENFFFAIWENRSFGNDAFVFNFYFTEGASSTQGISGPPHGNYIKIPWTYTP